MTKDSKRTTSSPARFSEQAEQASHYARDDVRTESRNYSEMEDRYSRDAAAARYSASQQSQRKNSDTLKKAGLGLLITLAILGLGVFGYMAAVNMRLSSGVDDSVKDVLVKTDLTREPFYMVLLGTDESIDRNETMSTDGVYRTDTIILARLDPIEHHATLVSMQRDTQVDLPGYGIQKLNAAYTFGGPELAISTVSNIAGVGISHFVLIDMNGLQQVVDSLGGIDVNVPMEIWDDDAGGYLPAGE
ncbi:MAG: LCP family protein, partial [Eggerthellaceae bacterium]|nr:LCP family protein [Eggerthellaceae bacterium]